MRNNDTQHIVRLRGAAPLRTVLTAPRDRHAEDMHEVIHQFSSFDLSRGMLGKFVTLLLLPMIFVYPLAPAYAADEEASSTVANIDTPPVTETTPSPNTDSLVADLSSAVTGAAAVVGGLFDSEGSSTDGTVSTDSGATETTSSTTLPVVSSTESSTSTDGTASSTEPTLPTTEATSTESGDASATPVFGGTDTSSTTLATGSSTDEVLEASSTDTVVAPERSAQEIAREMLAEKEDSLRASIRKEVEDEFTKGCVSLDTTGYYCLKERPNNGESLTPSAVVTDVSSSLDAGGEYKQIFMTQGGEHMQLTHYVWDNAFPSIDVSGRSIVWQGNVNGRWQIFYASVPATGTPAIIQVTHSNESNFNPKVDGDDIVWQGWVDGNWEVFLAEHLTPENYLSSTTLPENNKLLSIDNTWKVTRVTTNSVHDMFPSIAGGLATWQSFQEGTWNVYVYSLKSGTTQRISKSGGKSEQPRFAITWDERTTEGNARMMGYDIASGKAIDLTDEARQVNDQKPYAPPTTPLSQPDQAALPITGVGTSTTAKSEGDASSTPNGLEV